MTNRSYSQAEPGADISTDALVEALNTLRLRGFAWYGCGPEPQNEVLYALAKNSSRSLLELVLP